jgi:N-acetylmuramoyl-L-alanine amidase
MTRNELAASLKLEENMIPAGRKNRPGTLNVPKYITIHNTDNASAGADARSHGRFLISAGHYMLNGKQHWVSWHYSVDDKRVVKHLPISEKAYHAASANGQSIAIEVCMNAGIDQEKAFLNAARLTALLLYDLSALNRDVNKVVPHHFWTGKNCPRLLLNNGQVGSKWKDFQRLIQQELANITEALGPGTAGVSPGTATEGTGINVEVTSDFHVEDIEVEKDATTYLSIPEELYARLSKEAEKEGIPVDALAERWLQEKMEQSLAV